jgi:hypothetical protein
MTSGGRWRKFKEVANRPGDYEFSIRLLVAIPVLVWGLVNELSAQEWAVLALFIGLVSLGAWFMFPSRKTAWRTTHGKKAAGRSSRRGSRR